MTADNLPVKADPELTAPVRGANDRQNEYVRVLATTDLTQPQAAKHIGVRYETAHRWIANNPDLKERVDEIMAIRRAAIREAAFNTLVVAGTEGHEETWEEWAELRPDGTEVTRRVHKKAPDVKSAAFIFKWIGDRDASDQSDKPWSFDLGGARDKPELGPGEVIEEGEVEE